MTCNDPGGEPGPLFSQLNPREVVLQWHGVPLIYRRACFSVLARCPTRIRYGKNGYAIQFHLRSWSHDREWVQRDAAGAAERHGRIVRRILRHRASWTVQ